MISHVNPVDYGFVYGNCVLSGVLSVLLVVSIAEFRPLVVASFRQPHIVLWNTQRSFFHSRFYIASALHTYNSFNLFGLTPSSGSLALRQNFQTVFPTMHQDPSCHYLQPPIDSRSTPDRWKRTIGVATLTSPSL